MVVRSIGQELRRAQSRLDRALRDWDERVDIGEQAPKALEDSALRERILRDRYAQLYAKYLHDREAQNSPSMPPIDINTVPQDILRQLAKPTLEELRRFVKKRNTYWIRSKRELFVNQQRTAQSYLATIESSIAKKEALARVVASTESALWSLDAEIKDCMRIQEEMQLQLRMFASDELYFENRIAGIEAYIAELQGYLQKGYKVDDSVPTKQWPKFSGGGGSVQHYGGTTRQRAGINKY
jgi:hypothetical protein